MKLKNIFTAASALALVAGFSTTAHAASLGASTGGVFAEELNFGAGFTTLLTVPVFADDDNDPLTGQANFFPDTEVVLDITLPTGASFANGFTFNNSNVGNASLISSSITGNTAQIVVRTADSTTTQVDLRNLSIDLSGCPTGNLVVAATFQNTGAAIGATASSADALTCVNAFQCEYQAQDAANGEVILLPDYISFQGGLPALIGTGAHTVDGTAIVESGGGTLLAASSQITAVNFDVNFVDITGITGVGAGNPGAPTACTIAGNTASCRITGAQAAGPVNIYINGLDGTLPIASQNVNISNVRTNFNQQATDLVTQEVCQASAALDRLQRQGRSFGFFDWVNEVAGTNVAGTNNVFRISGFAPDANGVFSDIPYTVTAENAEGSMGATPGPFTGTISAATLAAGNGTITLRADQDFGVDGGTDGIGRADYGFLFETNDLLDVDRLVVQNGQIFSFDDGANEALGLQSNNDFDDTGTE